MFNEESKTENGLLIYNSATSGIILLNEAYTKKISANQRRRRYISISRFNYTIRKMWNAC